MALSAPAVLDHWLIKHARVNQADGATWTFVVCEENRVLAYYALASGSVSLVGLTGKFSRYTSDPIPVVMLGRLAVDLSLAGKGVGRALFKDAVQRVAHAANIIGNREIVAHPISDDARAFYLKLGFAECAVDSEVMLVTLKDAHEVFNSISA